MKPGNKLSIVMATRNAASSIAYALESVHDYAGDAELVVVDGASTDATLSILELHKNRIHALISESDKGIYDALSKGFHAARGEWIYVMGADDRLLPGFSRAAAQLNDPAIAYYGSVRLNPSGRKYGGKFGSLRLMAQNICHQAIFFPRQHWVRLGGFDDSFPLLADYAFNLKAFWDPLIRYEYVDEIVCDYHEGGSSVRAMDSAFSLRKAELLKAHAPKGLFKLYRGGAYLWSKMPVPARRFLLGVGGAKLRPSINSLLG
jgi:glycosyltransferase involved in cell wall biosynthesis